MRIVTNTGRTLPHASGVAGAERGRGVSAQADVVALTGAFFTNHAFDGLIRLCRPRAFVLMLGDFVPFTPLPFDHGGGGRLVQSRGLRSGESASLCQPGRKLSINSGGKRLTMFKQQP
ncbi:hypothetical protein K9F62_13945 [Desulfovibrio sp. JY]|nr:hypothetical protein K9F62_13945 [Desulfovibrio sp. JY]